MQAVVLAAGRGTRLLPLTRNRTKAMLPVVGKPVVERVMDGLRAGGIREFIVVASPEDRAIRPYFEEHSLIDARVRFVEQPEPLGMADALHSAMPLIEGDFILSACDNLVPVEDIRRLLARWTSEPRPAALLSLLEVEPEQVEKSGVVSIEGARVLEIVEKPSREQAPANTISLPLYLFAPMLLDHLAGVPRSPRGEYELQDAIQALIDRGSPVYGERVSSRMTLTGPSDLLAINRNFLQSSQRIGFGYPASVGHGTQILPPVFIEEGTRIREECTIGPNAYIEPDCRIEARAVVREAVVLKGSVVAAGALVENQVIG